LFAIADKIYQAGLWVISALLAVLTVVVSYQVLGRYASFVPRALWTEEVSRLCLAWMVFLGAALAVRRSEHFVIDLIPERVQRRLAQPIQLVVLAGIAGAGFVILLGGIGFAETGFGRTSTTSGIQMVWAYVAMPVAGAGIIFFALELAVRALRGTSLVRFAEDLTTDGGADRPESVRIGVGE
jgi:TRAP-type C4-dicarboxylate transport system permease small subunit